jgi:hypothetical protein
MLLDEGRKYTENNVDVTLHNQNDSQRNGITCPRAAADQMEDRAPRKRHQEQQQRCRSTEHLSC